MEFNYIDVIEKDRLKHICERALPALSEVSDLLKEYGLNVTTKTMQAALGARKVEKTEDSPNQPMCLNPNLSDKNPKLQVIITDFEGCDAIRDVFEKRVNNLSKNQTKQGAASIRENTMGEFNELMEKIIEAFPKGLDAGGQYVLAPIIKVDEQGEITTTMPIEEYCESVASHYVSTKKGIEAKNKVMELCKTMNEIKALFKPFSVTAGAIMVDGGDTVSPAQIDYDMYFKDSDDGTD